MAETVCKSCGKPFLADRAGSVTSFFFQHNYCQCHVTGPSEVKLPKAASEQLKIASEICGSCGKSRPTKKHAGSFTSFLFKELRCTCAGAASGNSSKGSNRKIGRTTTAARTAQRKQFTQSLKNRVSQSQQPASPQILANDSVIGGFRLIELVGIGGMGAVYLVEHIALGRKFALKILTPELVNEQIWQRFKAEAKILAALNHPTLVKVYDLGVHDQTIPFYSMDYLNGRSIEQILVQDGPIDLDTTINIMLVVLDGLAYAHRNGIVHRDLKPGNIMTCTIDGAEAVKVLDFGISKLIDSRGTAQAMTMAGDIFGSPFYMSPEQSAGESVDARSDIYSIGCTIFEMLTGFVPYENQSSIEIMMMHQEADIPLLGEVSDTEFPPSVDLVLAKCLAKSPEARYQSAKELAIDLTRIKEGKPVNAYAQGFAQRGANTTDKEEAKKETSITAIVLLGLAVATLIASGLIFYYWTTQHKQHQSLKPTVNAIFDGNHVLPESEFTEVAAAKPSFFSHIAKDPAFTTFTFPSNQSIGEICSDHRQGEVFEAKGNVTLANKSGFKFIANRFLIEHPNLFQGFRPNELTSVTTPHSSDEILKLKIALPQICALTGISRLDAQLSELDDNDIPCLNKLTSLVDLNLSFTEVTGKGLAKLLRLRDLEKLIFNYNKDIPDLIKAMAGAKNIRELCLDSPEKPLEDEDLRLIGQLKTLHFLSLQNTGITDKNLELLYDLPRLTSLNVIDCPLSKEAIAKLRKAYNRPNLTIVCSTEQLMKLKGDSKGDIRTGL
ncbi:MAG: protein kinase [Candidatus Obscuribacterales bacterium]|jgi:serine/threonine-protein kinase